MPDAPAVEHLRLDASNVLPYLVRRGILPPSDPVAVQELAGGVSCSVFAIEAPGRSLVVKQALSQLRVAQPWHADPRRSTVEAAALSTFGALTPEATPVLVDSDDEAHALTMTRAPEQWTSWKYELLNGNAERAVAHRLGAVLGTWHTGTREPARLPLGMHDLSGFHELRVMPYHRAVQARHPAHHALIEDVIEAMLDNRRCLVHGDFSPKNVLVGSSGCWVLDFEVAHFGDPAFDVAFLLTHLLLKAVHVPSHAADYRSCADGFIAAYVDVASPDLMATPDRLAGHLGCLLLARVDGKSPAEYLSGSEQIVVRRVALQLLERRLVALDDIFAALTSDRS